MPFVILYCYVNSCYFISKVIDFSKFIFTWRWERLIFHLWYTPQRAPQPELGRGILGAGTSSESLSKVQGSKKLGHWLGPGAEVKQPDTNGPQILLCRHAVPHHFQLPLFHKYCCVVRTHTRGRFNLISRFKKSDCSLLQTRISFTGKANILSKKDQWHTASTSAASKLSTIFVNNISWAPRHTNLFTHCLWLLLCYKGRTEVVRH